MTGRTQAPGYGGGQFDKRYIYTEAGFSFKFYRREAGDI